MVWLLIESNVLRKIVILPSSTLKVRPSIRWFHILSFTTLPSLKMGALPPWNLVAVLIKPGIGDGLTRQHPHRYIAIHLLNFGFFQMFFYRYAKSTHNIIWVKSLSGICRLCLLRIFLVCSIFSLLALMEDLRHKQVKTYRVSPSNEILYPSIFILF